MESDDEGWIARLMRKIACGHEWKMLKETVHKGFDGGTAGITTTYTCSKCGKWRTRQVGECG